MVLFRGGAKRALTLVLDVFLSPFSLLIHYCAARVSSLVTFAAGFLMRRNVSAELADSQYLHNQANGGKNAHHHDSET